MSRQPITQVQTLDDVLDKVLNDIEHSISPEIITINDLMIRDRNSNLINLGQNLNVNQREFLERIQINPFEYFRMEGLREISLKGRQLGITTLICALVFCDTVNNPRRYTAVLAHDDETTKKIFEIIKRFYDNLPQNVGKKDADKTPALRYNTKTDLTFKDLDSQIYVLTAGTKSAGQGTTPNNVVCSEVASYPDMQSIKSNLFQGVSAQGNIFQESTAEGVGNIFHVDYLEAQEGQNVFRAHFFPWYREPEYRMQPPSDYIPSDDDVRLAFRHSLDIRQLYWYKAKCVELKHEVKQEYPLTPEEAFISSGGDFFSGEILQEYIRTAKTLQPVSLPGTTVLPIYYKECHWTNKAKLVLWEKPKEGARYIITADSSEGDENVKSDFSSVDIIDIDTYTQVGHLHGKIEPHILGRICVELGWYYNTALIVPERNNHGHTVINEILHHTKYPKMDMHGWGGLYYHTEYDAAKRQSTQKPGLPTNTRTKFLIIDALNSAISGRDIAISNLPTLIEMLNYKVLGKGKYGAPTGLKDDRVMSLALGAYVMLNRPRQIVRQKSKVITKGGYA